MSNIIELHKNNPDRERRRKRRKFRRRLNRIFLFILALGIGLIFIFNSKLFALDKISINGLNKLSDDDILMVVDFNLGDNIFKISKKESRQLIQEVSYVKDSSIKRKLPNELIIDVQERVENFVISLNNTILYNDNEGYILRINRENLEEEIIGLPQIKGLDLVYLDLGDKIFTNNDNLDLSELIEELTKLEIYYNVEEIDVTDKDNINIVFDDGLLVGLGTNNDVKYKISLLNTILEDIESKDILVKEILFNRGDNPVIITEN